jgi:hypothetical protein
MLSQSLIGPLNFPRTMFPSHMQGPIREYKEGNHENPINGRGPLRVLAL